MSARSFHPAWLAVLLSGCASIVGADFDGLHSVGSEFDPGMTVNPGDHGDGGSATPTPDPPTPLKDAAPSADGTLPPEDASSTHDSAVPVDAATPVDGSIGVACDLSGTNAFIYMLEAAQANPAVPCPCSGSNECCYMNILCIAK